MKIHSLSKVPVGNSRAPWRAVQRLSRVVAAGVIMILGAEAQSNVPAANGNGRWVGTWATALHQPDLGVPGLSNPGFQNRTLRQIIHTSIGGRQVRVRLSTFGAAALTVGAAHVAIRTSGAAIMAASDRVLTFGGRPSITIPPGAL